MIEFALGIVVFGLGFLASQYQYRRDRIDRYSMQLYEAKIDAALQIARAIEESSPDNLTKLHRLLQSRFFLFPDAVGSKMLALLENPRFTSDSEAMLAFAPLLRALRDDLALEQLEKDFLKAIRKAKKKKRYHHRGRSG